MGLSFPADGGVENSVFEVRADAVHYSLKIRYDCGEKLLHPTGG
jgi:hypothetical protein